MKRRTLIKSLIALVFVPIAMKFPAVTKLLLPHNMFERFMRDIENNTADLDLDTLTVYLIDGTANEKTHAD